MKIALCIPTYNSIRSEWFIWFSEILFDWIKKYDLELFTISAQPVDYARNKLIRMVLDTEKKFDYILFIDSDTICPFNTIDILVSDNKEIVSGLYFSRVHPYNPMIFRDTKKVEGEAMPLSEPIKDFKINELLEVDSIGLGCALIKFEVFKILSFPWFDYVQVFNKEKNSVRYISEDHYFCDRLKEKGIKIYADTRILCRHQGSEVGIEHFQFLKDL